MAVGLLLLTAIAFASKWLHLSFWWFLIALLLIATIAALTIWLRLPKEEHVAEIRATIRAAQKRTTIGRLSSLPTVFVLQTEVIGKAELGAALLTPTPNSFQIWVYSGTVFVEIGLSILSSESYADSIIDHFRPNWIRRFLGLSSTSYRSCVVVCDSSAASGAEFGGDRGSLERFVQQLSRSTKRDIPIYALLRADKVEHYPTWSKLIEAESAIKHAAISIPATTTVDCQVIPAFAANAAFEAMHETWLSVLVWDRLIRKSQKLNLESFLFIGSSFETQEMTSTGAARWAFGARNCISAVEHVSQRSHAHKENPFLRAVALVGLDAVQPARSLLGSAIEKVIVGDEPARRIGDFCGGTIGWRPIIAIAVVAALLVGLCWSSALKNKRLAEPFLAHLPAESAFSIDGLRDLDEQREGLERMRRYEAVGPPWTFRMGLYSGHQLLPDANVIYFGSFRRVLLSPLQSWLVEEFRSRSVAPGPKALNPTYLDLRTYLLTTAEVARPERAQIAKHLSDLFNQHERLSGEAATLVQRQFEYYSKEPATALEFTLQPNAYAVSNARGYVCQALSPTRIGEIEAATSDNQSRVEFKEGSIVTDRESVEGAFTPAGWRVVTAQIGDAANASVEPWVIPSCSAGTGQISPKSYTEDYGRAWRRFLAGASVARFRSPQDAARGLQELVANSSPLMRLLCLASENTDVQSSEITSAFQPVHQVVPPNTCRQGKLVSESNREYMNALVALQAAMDNVARTPDDPAALQQAREYGTRALSAASQIALGFPGDDDPSPIGVDKAVAELLRRPVQTSLATIQGKCPGCVPLPPPPPPPGKQGVCTAFEGMSTKFPFKPDASEDVDLKEFNSFFSTGGQFSKFRDNTLRRDATIAGDRIELRSGAKVDPAFIRFAEQVLRIQRTAYAGPEPQILFTVTPWLPPGFSRMRMRIDGVEVTSTGDSKEFKWPGEGVTLTLERSAGQGTEIFNASGPWAVFRLSGAAVWPKTTDHAAATLMRTVPGAGNAPVPVLQFDGGPSDFIFRPDFLSNLKCGSEPH